MNGGQVPNVRALPTGNAAVEAQAHIVLDRKKLHVDHIKTTGTYQVAAKLHHDVEFPITISVTPK